MVPGAPLTPIALVPFTWANVVYSLLGDVLRSNGYFFHHLTSSETMNRNAALSDVLDLPIYPDLKDKIAIVIGIGQSGPEASSAWGNGAAIARVLSRSGAIIHGCDLYLQAAERTATRVRAEGGKCDVSHADATSSSDISRLVDDVLAKHGRVDILVNNVGMTANGDLGTMAEETFDSQITLNLKTVYISCHKLLPIMESQGEGVIINNASIAGLRHLGKPQVAYSSAKAALVHLTRVTAVDYASKGIRVNCVIPGLMYTPLVEMLGNSENAGDRHAYERIIGLNVPMGMMGDGMDVGNATAFLASRAAKYITGHGLVVDGGLTVSASS